LPKADLNDEETLDLVLRDMCGIPVALPEPEWITNTSAPGQNIIEQEIADLRLEFDALMARYRDAEHRKSQGRSALGLLYQRGLQLEATVRQVLRSLGAVVEDPVEVGKEDGWITASAETEVFRGVLEVKSTKHEFFDESGLRQLADWKFRGVMQRQQKYKGICVGLSSVEKPVEDRPYPFNANWAKQATLQEIVAIRAEDLYVVYCLDQRGALDRDAFWRQVFTTDGVFDASMYHQALEGSP
jgi:hypothetical protein